MIFVYSLLLPRSIFCLAGCTATSFISMKGVLARTSTSRSLTTRASNLNSGLSCVNNPLFIQSAVEEKRHLLGVPTELLSGISYFHWC